MDLEVEGGSPGESRELDIGSLVCPCEHAHVRHIEHAGQVDEILDDILWSDLEVGGCVRLHHFTEVTRQLLDRLSGFT